MRLIKSAVFVFFLILIGCQFYIHDTRLSIAIMLVSAYYCRYCCFALVTEFKHLLINFDLERPKSVVQFNLMDASKRLLSSSHSVNEQFQKALGVVHSVNDISKVNLQLVQDTQSQTRGSKNEAIDGRQLLADAVAQIQSLSQASVQSRGHSVDR